ncbi:hypothetical protein [Flavobacterium sp.]|uniref:hypothetical protein n=1 Tax=Flavobacterium sp. TaxID=239 RepID=UPI003D6B8E13
MKYFLVLFISVLAVTGCDNGDLIVESFNFENATIQKCTDANVLYKISAQEALVLTIPETNFENAETPANTPRVVTITGTTSIKYRKYSGTPTAATICGTPTLSVLEEWDAIGGTVEITTVKILGTDNTTVIGYNHNIVFKNVTFNTPDKQVVYDSYEFGNYRTDVIDLDFDYASAATQNCGGNNLIFKYNTNNALLLDVDQSLFANAATPVGSPRTALINTTTNKVVYRVYSGGLNINYFCSAITPATPTLTEEWVAEDGIASTSGIITVDTEATIDPNVFKHTIRLYKTTFKKGIYKYSPVPNDYYTFGVYYTTL